MLLRIAAALLGMWMMSAPHDHVGADGRARARLASSYAAQAKHLLASSQLVAARTAYQRALQLAPDAQTAPALRAQLQFINTELALTMRR